MPQAVASHDFTVVRQDKDHLVTYQQAKLGLRNYASMLWPGLILAIFLAYRKIAADERFTTPQEKLSMGIFYALCFMFLIPLGVLIGMNLLRRKGSFTLGPDGIGVGGKTYPWKDIRGLYIKSPSGQVSQPMVPDQFGMAFVWSNDRDFNLQFGTTMAVASSVNVAVQAATMLSRISGQEFMKSIRRVSHKVCFRFGKEEIVIARGMTIKQAEDLLNSFESIMKA